MSKRLILWLCFAIALWLVTGMFFSLTSPRHARIPRQRVQRLPPGFEPGRPPRPLNPTRNLPPVEEDQTVEKVALTHSDTANPPAHSPKHKKKANKATAGGEELFNNTFVPKIQIEIPNENIEIMRNGGWDFRQERPTVKSTVREGGIVYTNVAVHLKGSMGSFRTIDDNPCLTLNFEKYSPGQTFHGIHKLSLNNSIQDHSFISEKICREMFEAAGVPVGRSGHAMVVLNGQNLGLHVLTEGLNKQFLKRYFKNTSGNLYDAGFKRDITSQLEVVSGDNTRDNSGLRALARAASETDPAKRLERLDEVLDMDRFYSFIAMELIQCHWDGYAMAQNNWRIFHDLDSKKMVFFPHGLDQMFGVKRADPDYPILPYYMEGFVASAVVGTPEGRRRYLERMGQLYTNVFKVDDILKRVDEIAALIRPVMDPYNGPLSHHHQEEVRRLKIRISERYESLKRQLQEANVK